MPLHPRAVAPWCAPRRGVDVATIAVGLAARLRGHTHQEIGTELGVPADTVRGWLHRLADRAEQLRCHALDRLTELDHLSCGLAPTGSPLAVAAATLATATEAARARLGGGPEHIWPLLGLLGLTRHLAPAPGG